MANPGERVGAIISADPETKTVTFAGYGVYIGDEIPPEGVTIMGIDLHKLQRPNPRINLDTGKTIWGCQCWWGSENRIKAEMEKYKATGFSVLEV